MVWRQAGLDPRVPAVLARAADSSVPRSFPFHLLLLPWRVLQGVLGRSAVVRGRRAAQALLGRAVIPADSAERSSVFPLHRVHLPVPAVVRRVAGDALARWRRRDKVRHRSRHDPPRGQRRAPQLLHARLPRDAAHRRRLPRRRLQARRVRHGLCMLDRAQLQAPALRVVEPVHGGLLRFVRPTLLHGDLDRLQDPLMPTASTYTYDVLVIGAGGAGLRAAIEAPNSGVSVGPIGKSLLAQAPTVMAEGGMAGALAKHDAPRNWEAASAD